jgi:hypothetical protein
MKRKKEGRKKKKEEEEKTKGTCKSICGFFFQFFFVQTK